MMLNGSLLTPVVFQLTTSILGMRMLLLHSGVIMTFAKKAQFVMLPLRKERVLRVIGCLKKPAVLFKVSVKRMIQEMSSEGCGCYWSSGTTSILIPMELMTTWAFLRLYWNG